LIIIILPVIIISYSEWKVLDTKTKSLWLIINAGDL